MALLEINNLSHSYDDKVLYKNASLEIFKGEHVGIVGPNGAGKSTFLKIITNEVIPDRGEIKWQRNVSLGILDQYAQIDENLTIYDYLNTAFNDLYEMDKKLTKLYDDLSKNYHEDILRQISYYQNELQQRDFYSLNTIILKTASGLGLSALGLDNQIKNLSGGQRAKVILARLLLQNPEVLILDEPTNFLDKEHILWLTTFLKSYPHTFLVVSHDTPFLEEICTSICDIAHQKINKYKGTFQSFLKQKQMKSEEYERAYVSQQKEIKKLEIYIEKNKARASTAKMAKSREKKLAKIEKLDNQVKLAKPNFAFSYKELNDTDVLEISNLTVGYYYPLLKNVCFKIRKQEKIALIGFNGLGKSTLIKTILGYIPSLGGNVTLSSHLQINYFEQDLKWDDDSLSPIKYLEKKYPTKNNKEIRSVLAKSALKSEQQMQNIKTLSGGEQAKIKIAELMLKPSNLLILDEPTNHLDELAKKSLQEAILKYEGALILVSHDESFYKSLDMKIIDVTTFLSRK